MATVPLIFPSLSRQPSMDSSRSLEDDTIRDSMESGYVATRPRFTRARRTWKVNVRNLQTEDVRALDQFVMVNAARGGNAFLFPSLLRNGSFEFAPCSEDEVAAGWERMDGNAQFTVATATPGLDGATALSLATVAGQAVNPGASLWGQVISKSHVACTPGEVYVLSGAFATIQGTLPAGALIPWVAVSFFDIDGNALSTAGSAFSASGAWQTGMYQFTVPAGAAAFSIILEANLTSAGALTLDGSAYVLWDTVACALLTPLTPYGRMAGSQSLGCFVRFTKLPEVSDIGYGGGVKRYGANFELSEV